MSPALKLQKFLTELAGVDVEGSRRGWASRKRAGEEVVVRLDPLRSGFWRGCGAVFSMRWSGWESAGEVDGLTDIAG